MKVITAYKLKGYDATGVTLDGTVDIDHMQDGSIRFTDAAGTKHTITDVKTIKLVSLLITGVVSIGLG